jgi:inactivated superfamily I helicase
MGFSGRRHETTAPTTAYMAKEMMTNSGLEKLLRRNNAEAKDTTVMVTNVHQVSRCALCPLMALSP